MKQTIFIFTLCSILFSALHAQDINNSSTTIEPSEKLDINIRHEIGINGTYLLKQIISLSDTSFAISPYLLTYKLMFNNFGIRAGVGATYKKEKRSPDEDFADSNSNTESSFDTRFGIEFQKHFHKRWTAAVGFDFVYNNASSKFIADTGFDVATVEQKSGGFGGGPVLGLYFHLNDNLSIYTEGSFYFLSKKEEQTNKFTNFPQFNDRTDTVEVSEFDSYLPASIFFVFRF